jgi:phosphohistidine phosphatase
MRLCLLQHGEALSEETDPRRSLSEQGHADVTYLARVLPPLDIRRIVHSSKRRAEQTARIIAKNITPVPELSAVDGLAPLDPIEPFAKNINSWNLNTLIVGHLPFLGLLTDYLLRIETGASARVIFQPGTMVCLDQNNNDWKIAWMLNPRLNRPDD